MVLEAGPKKDSLSLSARHRQAVLRFGRIEITLVCRVMYVQSVKIFLPSTGQQHFSTARRTRFCSEMDRDLILLGSRCALLGCATLKSISTLEYAACRSFYRPGATLAGAGSGWSGSLKQLGDDTNCNRRVFFFFLAYYFFALLTCFSDVLLLCLVT